MSLHNITNEVIESILWPRHRYLKKLTKSNFEGKRSVMRLEHADVVVENGERVVGVAEEGGGSTGMVDVMSGSRDQSGSHLQRLKQVL